MAYDINNMNTIGLAYNGSFWNNEENSKNFFSYYQNSSFDSIQNSPSQNKTDYDFHSFSAYYEVKLDTIGKKINFTSNYLTKNNVNKQNLASNTFNDIEQENIINSSSSNNNTNSDYNIFTIGTDMLLPLGALNIEFGSKYTLSNNSSLNKYFNTSNGTSILVEELSDNFKYKEQILAFYFSVDKELGDFWTAQLGLRYEYTSNERKSLALNEITKKNFDNLFPTFFLTYDPNENHSFSFAYSKRIERPGFFQLNPFRIYSNTNSYESGNPNLIPSISHNFEISYIYKNNLYFTLYDTYLKDASDYLTITNESTNEIVSLPVNYFNQNTLGLDLGYNYKPFQWLNSYNSASIYFNKSKSFLTNLTTSEFEGTGLYISTKNSISLNKSKDMYLMINFFQDLPSTEGFIKAYNRASLDIGFRTKLFNKKLNISSMITDLFEQNRNKTLEVYPTYRYNTNIYNDIRKFNISLSYTFGGNAKKMKKINLEEQDRL